MPSSDDRVTSSVIRPMLPPFHALGLPTAVKSDGQLSHDPNGVDSPVSKLLIIQVDSLHKLLQNSSSTDSIHWKCTRQKSLTVLSSPNMRYRCNSSPCLDRNTPTPPPDHMSTNGFSLVLTTFENANAFVVVPAPQPYVPGISNLSRTNSSVSSSRTKSRRNQAFLLIGPAVENFRRSRTRVTKGTRVHPYRIVSNTQRRPPTPTGPSPTDMEI